MLATPNKPRYHTLKIVAAVIGVLAVIVLGIHLWFVYNAKSVLKSFITEQSSGKIKLELSQLDLNLLSKNLQVHQATLISTDSLSQPITYRVTFSKLSLNVGSVWQLLFNRQLNLDSLKLYNPVIEVMQWRKDTTRQMWNDDLSIPQEMGKIYNSMMTTLDAFGIRRIVIDNARFHLINKMKPESQPVIVSNIFFDLARTPVKGKRNNFAPGVNTIELKSNNQDIRLSGGRHRLAFKSFNLHLYRQSIELDSCTITAVATDSVKSNYNIFFKKLLLTGVDFNALATQNLIKADSVYCDEPLFNFNLYRKDAVARKTELPDPGNIVQELAGNLDLGFVGVSNAGIQMDIYGRTKRSFYNSNKDNFEIRGFRVNPNSSTPVSVARFDMLLRDYLLYNEDSSSVYSFDSLHFLNNKVILSNFAVLSTPSSSKLRNLVDAQVPYFTLTQLDWYQLIFEQNLVAKEAILLNPVINYTRRKPTRPGKKINLFTTLLNVDSLVSLENVSVVNGDVNMKLGPSTSFNIENIDFNIHSNRLLSSKNEAGLRNAVEELSFSKGILKIKDITAELQNARFTGNNLIYADKVNVWGKQNRIKATINDVSIDNLLLDDKTEAVEVDGLTWERANISLQALPSGKGRNSGNLYLRNIEGNNSQIAISTGTTTISTFVNTLLAHALVKRGNAPVQVEGFNIDGNTFALTNKALKLQAASYRLSGDDVSTINGVQVQQIKGQDSLQIQATAVNFTADLNDLMANNLYFTNVKAFNPVINLIKRDTATTEAKQSATPAPIRIDQLTATEPVITITTHRNDSTAILNIPQSAGSTLQATGISISEAGTAIGSVQFNTTSASFTKATGDVLGVEKGNIDMALSNIQLGRTGGKMNWSGFINNLSLHNANGLQMGKSKNNLFFENASVGNLNLSSDLLPNFGQLLKQNVAAWLHIPQGYSIDSNTTLRWYNAAFNNSTGTLTLDSFVYHPTKTLDSVLAHAPYQLDYITLKTGNVAIDGFDIAQYEKDSSFIAHTVTISEPLLTVYRDKLQPLSPFRKDKLLLTELIKNIPLPVAVQNIKLEDGLIIYGEKNGKSRMEGTVFLSNVNSTISNIKNRNLATADSLGISMQARLMDAAPLDLKLTQSYTDTLSSFLLDATIAATDLAILNPVMQPLSNISITSGTLDSVSFKVVGRKDIALGEMQMHYNKLRIKLIKNGNAEESSFFQNIASFLANTFLIRSNNHKRMGVMYHERLSKQSFVNYIIKTTLSGITSTVGIKRNSKLLKQYKQHLKEKQVPPIDL